MAVEREPEVREHVDLVAEGRVDPRALGWSRGALHRCVVPGPWGRRKRWHHWCVTSDAEALAITVLDADVLTAAIVSSIDRSARRAVKEVGVRSGGLGEMPERADRGAIDVRAGRVRVTVEDVGERIAIRARSPRVDADVEVHRPASHDTLGVATAWPGTGGARYAYSSKQTGLPARGRTRVEGRAAPIADGARACLDWGRGVWPSRTSWNWASASGEVDGHAVGLNLGARWTHDVTENAVLVDGRMEKIHGDVRFEWDRAEPRRAWRLRGRGVDLALEPEVIEGARVPLVGRLCIAFGVFRGEAQGVSFDGVFGWAEELSVRW
ncbi:MAG: DUF2804 domain-containing protein [Polyangiaceae bacterium]